jgi:hypothetical protein
MFKMSWQACSQAVLESIKYSIVMNTHKRLGHHMIEYVWAFQCEQSLRGIPNSEVARYFRKTRYSVKNGRSVVIGRWPL